MAKKLPRASRMAKRKAICDSLRWMILARDGFAFRYCGRQAGEDGVVLVIDHVLSVKDGGDNRADNLVTSCKMCNGGKSAKSLQDAPATQDAIDRVRERNERLEAMRVEISETIRLQKETEQSVVDLKCYAYGTETTELAARETTIVRNLIGEFGAEQVVDWHVSAAKARCWPNQAINYVCGCAKNKRAEEVES